MFTYKKMISALILSTILTGCKGASMPTATIKAPLAVAVNLNDEDINKAIKNYISEDIKIAPPKYPEDAKAVLQKDIDGDGENELIVTIMSKNNGYTGGILVLKKEKDSWRKLLYTYDEGLTTNRIDFADVDGDGKKELLVSNFIGGSAGNGLRIYKWDKDNLNLIGKAYYKKIFIEDMPDINGKKDGKEELALWLKDTGDSYFTEVYRYDNKKLTKAKDVYPYHFEKVAIFYKEKLDGEFKNGIFLWYHYADALVKSGKPKEALDYINGLNFDNFKDNPYEYSIKVVKAEAYNSLKDYKNAVVICNDMLKDLKAEDGLDYTGVYNVLVDAYTGLNDKEKAKYYYDKASEVKDFFIDEELEK